MPSVPKRKLDRWFHRKYINMNITRTTIHQYHRSATQPPGDLLWARGCGHRGVSDQQHWADHGGWEPKHREASGWLPFDLWHPLSSGIVNTNRFVIWSTPHTPRYGELTVATWSYCSIHLFHAVTTRLNLAGLMLNHQVLLTIIDLVHLQNPQMT